MPKRNLRKNIDVRIMPLFVIAVSLVFAFIYTVLLFPLAQTVAAVDVRLIFIAMLVTSVTVASVVAIVFYLIFSKKL